MGMNEIELNEHIEIISKSRRIKNKIVILCEGDIAPLIRSPQGYSKLEELPDANFYKNCIPSSWREHRPQFFTCGDRNGVINTYFGLLEYQKKSPDESYLEPNKLFALVDLDLQPRKIEGDYPFTDIDAIFADLYHHVEVTAAAPHHRIWVTGLLHKEAYFLHPMLHPFFDELSMDKYVTLPIFDGKPIQLPSMYFAMSQAIESDPDLRQHFARACQRIGFCDSLNCASPIDLKQSWQAKFQQNHDIQHNLDIIYGLLLIVKSKDYWRQVEPDPNGDWTKENSLFQDQLSLAIARHISTHAPANHHLSVFFETLYQHELNHRSNA